MIKVNGVVIEPTIFPEGTSQIWKLPSEAFDKEPFIDWFFEDERECLWILQLVDLLSTTTNTRPTLSVPYMPFARQDKAVSNSTTFALATFLICLHHMGLGTLLTFDVHNPKALKGFKFQHYDTFPLEQINTARTLFSATTLCFPDSGAKERYKSFVFPSITLKKVRNQQTGEITGLDLDSFPAEGNNKILIVDDICDGGRTFIEAAKLLNDTLKPEAIALYVSHGIFSKGTQCLYDAGISEIYTRNGRYED